MGVQANKKLDKMVPGGRNGKGLEWEGVGRGENWSGRKLEREGNKMGRSPNRKEPELEGFRRRANRDGGSKNDGEEWEEPEWQGIGGSGRAGIKGSQQELREREWEGEGYKEIGMGGRRSRKKEVELYWEGAGMGGARGGGNQISREPEQKSGNGRRAEKEEKAKGGRALSGRRDLELNGAGMGRDWNRKEPERLQLRIAYTTAVVSGITTYYLACLHNTLLQGRLSVGLHIMLMHMLRRRPLLEMPP